MSAKNDDLFSGDEIGRISFNTNLENLEKIFGKPPDTAEHANGIAVYYDRQAGHHELPLAKFALNKQGYLIGKTWYCHANCEMKNWRAFQKRYPAGTFVESVPTTGTGRKLNYGPNERLYANSAQGMKVEVDDNEIIAIHWDSPQSNYLNR